MTNVVEGVFIGEFKIGDNIILNLQTLDTLYELYDAQPSKQHTLIKPIVITIASIIEALLHDTAFRARSHTRELSLNIPKPLLNMFRRNSSDKFSFYIDQVKKHDFFIDSSGQIYSELYHLRDLRNRIHIQNVKGALHRDENMVYTEQEKIKAERLLERIIKFLKDKHSRPIHAQFKGKFSLPWPAHYP